MGEQHSAYMCVTHTWQLWKRMHNRFVHYSRVFDELININVFCYIAMCAAGTETFVLSCATLKQRAVSFKTTKSISTYMFCCGLFNVVFQNISTICVTKKNITVMLSYCVIIWVDISFNLEPDSGLGTKLNINDTHCILCVTILKIH